MKKSIFMLLLAVSPFNCSSDDTEKTMDIPEATLIGRWNVVGFEGLVLYEFTEDKRYRFYASPSEGIEFSTVEKLIADGFGHNGLDWWYEGKKVSVDLNFGHISTLKPIFVCDNYVINWLNDDDEIVETYFREGYNFSLCK